MREATGLLMLMLMLPMTSAYYTGYGEYGMNKSYANRLLSETKPELLWGLKGIIFKNSVCTGMWGGGCNIASFEYKGNWTMIIIGRYEQLDYDLLRYYFNHEVKHYQQWRSGIIREGQNGFNETIEQEADDFAFNMTYGGAI